MKKKNSILAHIATDFITQYENVANSSVAYLLNEYPAAQTALAKVLETDKVPASYETEVGAGQNGRPDITGWNGDGEKQVIIEGKFWANLTDNQPEGYLNELKEGDAKNGKLLFLAPKSRIASLKIEIKKRAGADIKRVYFCSWVDFLEQIGQENDKGNDLQLASDLLQIMELCQKRDTEGMPPLSASDLDPMNGKRMYHFINVINGCKKILKKSEHADTGKEERGDYHYGFCFYGDKFGCFLCFDSEYWFKYHTPIWLQVWVDSVEDTNKIHRYLKEYAVNSAVHYSNYCYGITLKVGDDEAQTIEHIIKEIEMVLAYLNEKMA